jgi:hypothetical protein
MRTFTLVFATVSTLLGTAFSTGNFAFAYSATCEPHRDRVGLMGCSDSSTVVRLEGGLYLRQYYSPSQVQIRYVRTGNSTYSGSDGSTIVYDRDGIWLGSDGTIYVPNREGVRPFPTPR